MTRRAVWRKLPKHLHGPRGPTPQARTTSTLKTPDNGPGPGSADPTPQSAGISGTRIALIIALAHAVTDAYASFVPPLLPRIMDGMGISIAAAASLGAGHAIATALPQPFFGYAADRFGRRALAVGGVVVSGIFVSVMGFASSYWTLMMLLIIGGLGGAAFHPPGASYAVRLTEGKGSGGRYSIFSFGGAVGFSAGPLVAVGLVSWGGMERLWVAMIPALVLAPLFFFSLPSGRGEVQSAPPAPPPSYVFRQLMGPLGIIFGVSSAMAFVQRAFLTMKPIIVAEMGGSETLGAAALSVYLGAQAFGTLTGGLLADRMDRSRLLFLLCALALPVHLAAVWLGPWSAIGFVTIAGAGFLGMATLPPIVVMAQEMSPRAPGASSGIVMGLAWTVGALGVMGTGAVADVTGPHTAALMSMPFAGVAALLALHPGLKWMPTGRTG